jgi:hypothetical protein
MLLEIALMGGLFSVLAFIHFFVDWIAQSHSEAMVKHEDSWVRAKHCLIYMAGFMPLFMFCHFGLLEWCVALGLLFGSHFYFDTYHLVYLWAKYIRRPPEMVEPIQKIGVDGYVTVLPPDPKEGFKLFVSTSIGKILMITIDQICHLTVLWPIAWMILNHIGDGMGKPF